MNAVRSVRVGRRPQLVNGWFPIIQRRREGATMECDTCQGQGRLLRVTDYEVVDCPRCKGRGDVHTGYTQLELPFDK